MKVKGSLLIGVFLIGMVVGVALWGLVPRPSWTEAVQTKTVTVTASSASLVYEVRFSPGGGCEELLIYWLNRANSSIHVMVYSFTLDSVGDALVAAKDRGVEVKVLLEKDQLSKYSEYWKLKEAGIQVRLDGNPALMHHKVAIIDGAIVITGSYNWSASAEKRNDENLLVVRSLEVAEAYEAEFQKVWGQGSP